MDGPGPSPSHLLVATEATTTISRPGNQILVRMNGSEMHKTKEAPREFFSSTAGISFTVGSDDNLASVR